MSTLSIRVFNDSTTAAHELAGEICLLMRARAAAGRSVVLGLATGSTPLPLYQELIRLHRTDGLSFANVISFNLDEYLGLERDHPASYRTFMHRHLFDHIDIPADNIHLLNGTISAAASTRHCAAYEQHIRQAGGLDFQLLGIGSNGHIGFNEPGSSKASRTRRIRLAEITRRDAAPSFDGLEQVPTHALTMGCGTILEARRIVLLAWGGKKSSIVRKALTGPITEQVGASLLQEHPNAAFYLDRASAAGCTYGQS
jgi:glucosamine-6-phosphate deaminase